MKLIKSNYLRKIAHQLIPGGAHTYSKGDDQFPALSPGFIVKGKGAYVWDVDGNKFLDWGMGLRSVILGHAYQPVLRVAKKQLEQGVNFTRPTPAEIELAKLLVKIIPCAEMAKFNKNGSATTTAAIKLARAYTKKEIVAMPAGAYNGSDDWGIATTPMKSGIPKTVQKLTATFNYNDIESVKKIFRKYPNKIACFILEPATEVEPKDNFLQKLHQLCRKNGALLIFDEMISGFRWHLKGSQYVYKVTPDLAIFGKAIGNGFSVAALVGKREIMKLGGIQGKQERVFLLSSTHGAEIHALTAAIKTIKELKKKNVINHVNKIGKKLQLELNKINKLNNLDKVIKVTGAYGSRLATEFHHYKKYDSAQIKTYFLQELISQKILFNGYFSPSFSHKQAEVEKTKQAWQFACQKLKAALNNNDLEKRLVGGPIKPVFRKFN